MSPSDGRRHPLALRTFDVPNSSTTSMTVRITEPSLVADNLPLETWASSTILASRLHLQPITFPTPTADLLTDTPVTDTDPDPNPGRDTTIIPILELGAGTGLVGITAAHIYGQPVVLTDLAPIVPGLWANVALNLDPGTSSILYGRTVQAGVLDWTSPDTLSIHPVPVPATPPDDPTTDPTSSGPAPRTARVFSAARGATAHVILAADTLYSAEHPALLTGVVGTWLSRSASARLVLGTALRVAYLDEIRELWTRLEELGLECVAEGKDEASAADFDDERLVEWSFWRWRT